MTLRTTCPICDMAITRDQHIEIEAHVYEEGYQCPVCNQLFAEQAISVQGTEKEISGGEIIRGLGEVNAIPGARMKPRLVEAETIDRKLAYAISTAETDDLPHLVSILQEAAAEIERLRENAKSAIHDIRVREAEIERLRAALHSIAYYDDFLDAAAAKDMQIEARNALAGRAP